MWIPPDHAHEQREKADHPSTEPERRRECDDDEGCPNRLLHRQRSRSRTEHLEPDAFGSQWNTDHSWDVALVPWISVLHRHRSFASGGDLE